MLWALCPFMPNNTFGLRSKLWQQLFLASGLGNCPSQFYGKMLLAISWQLVLAIVVFLWGCNPQVTTMRLKGGTNFRMFLFTIPPGKWHWQLSFAILWQIAVGNCSWHFGSCFGHLPFAIVFGRCRRMLLLPSFVGNCL